MQAGMEDVVAAETRLSTVDGEAGRLIVRGHDIDDLAGRAGFEAMAALLWDGLAPDCGDAAALRAQLGTARAAVSAGIEPFLRSSEGLTPIEALRAGLAMLADGDDNDHVRVTAAVPVFIAAHWRHSRGERVLPADPALGQVADFMRMLGGAPASEQAVAAVETYLVTVADHGMNASTFTARVVASTRAGIVSAVVAALCALKGPLHGGAPGPVLDMLDDIGDAAGILPWLEGALTRGERLMGFGHRVYRTRDPRADVLKQVVRGFASSDARVRFAETVERTAIAELARRYPERNLDTNVEFYTALALEAAGLPRDLFTPAFAMGRVLGWTAHAYEQLETGRILRPKSRYVGPVPRGAELKAVAG